MSDVNNTDTPAAAEGAETASEGAPVNTSLTAAADAGQSNGADGEASGEAGQGGTGDDSASGAASDDGEDSQGGEGQDSISGAPENYDAFNLPDGFELSGDMADKFTELAKAHNLTQEQAQAMVDLGVHQAQAIMGQYAEAAQASPVINPEHWGQRWSEELTADPELGGAKLESTMGLAVRVFATFGSEKLAETLNTTGFAHHPELVRFMHQVGKAIGEDHLVVPPSGEAKAQEQAGGADTRFSSTAQKFYGKKK